MSDNFESDFAAQIEAQSFLDTLQREVELLSQQRQVNAPKNVIALRQSFQNNKNVKSDLKKSNAFVKKLRAITSEGLTQCIRETETLNLTQFISEIVQAILATTFKAADVPLVVKLCVCLHQRYEEFSEPLLAGIKSSLLTLSTDEDSDGLKRKRVNIRLIVELFQAGIFIEEEFFCMLMRFLLGRGKG